VSPGRGAALVVEWSDDVWAQEVERLRDASPARQAANRARRKIDAHGLDLVELRVCDATGRDGTRLARCVKLYVPLSGAPSEQPYGFVFDVGKDPTGRPVLFLLAYGERHPQRGARSVYERAHKRRHGKYPDE
jgi:hypothetical protein